MTLEFICIWYWRAVLAVAATAADAGDITGEASGLLSLLLRISRTYLERAYSDRDQNGENNPIVPCDFEQYQ